MNSLQNPKASEFQQLQILHGALMAGATLVSIMLGFLLVRDGALADYSKFTSGFLPIAAAIMFMEIAISFTIWNRRQSNIPVTNVASEKWLHYRSSCILRWALLEGGILISVILTFLERNPAGFCIPAVGLVFLFLARPSRDYVAEQYKLEA